MDYHRNSLHGHHHACKSLEEVSQALLCTAMELETTRAAAQEELKRRDDQIFLLNQLLSKAIKERDEALMKSQKTHLENHLLRSRRRNLPAPATPTTAGAGSDPLSSVEDARPPVPRTDQASPDGEESTASPAAEEVVLVAKKPLPEKGRLLQAVMKAGPLLETLMLAGPLPEWKHPPPAMEAFEIPPVGIGGCESGGSTGSGVAGDGSSPTRPYKYQRLLTSD